MKKRLTESLLQKTVVRHLAVRGVRDLLWHSIPNEAVRTAKMGARMKSTGLRPGCADLCIIKPPDGKAHYLELKSAGGKLTEAQKVFQLLVTLAGAEYAWHDNIDDVLAQLAIWEMLR